MSIKFLVLAGGGILALGGGGGKCGLYFYGRGDFSDIIGLAWILGRQGGHFNPDIARRPSSPTLTLFSSSLLQGTEPYDIPSNIAHATQRRASACLRGKQNK